MVANLRLLAFLCLGGVVNASAMTAAPEIELQTARDFGYTMGSLIQHRIRVRLPEGVELLNPLLPSAGAVNEWLDLRSIHVEQESSHSARIDVSYQVFKGVREPETAVIPALTIAYRANGVTGEVRTPEWSFNLVPLIPPSLPDDTVVIRAAAAQPEFPAESAHLRFLAVLLVASLSAALLVARLGLFPGLRQRRPFAEACRRIAKLQSASPEYRLDQSLRIVHEALANSYGKPVFPDMLDAFFQARPMFMPLRGEFENFFQRSQRHFFLPASPDTDAASFGLAIENLCRRCARLEWRA